jgi:hypothetical protein
MLDMAPGHGLMFLYAPNEFFARGGRIDCSLPRVIQLDRASPNDELSADQSMVFGISEWQ